MEKSIQSNAGRPELLSVDETSLPSFGLCGQLNFIRVCGKVLVVASNARDDAGPKSKI